MYTTSEKYKIKRLGFLRLQDKNKFDSYIQLLNDETAFYVQGTQPHIV